MSDGEIRLSAKVQHNLSRVYLHAFKNYAHLFSKPSDLVRNIASTCASAHNNHFSQITLISIPNSVSNFPLLGMRKPLVFTSPTYKLGI